MAVCNEHGAFEEKFKSMERWQSDHMQEVHKPLNIQLQGLQNRLPLWATTLISVLMLLIGYLAK